MWKFQFKINSTSDYVRDAWRRHKQPSFYMFKVVLFFFLPVWLTIFIMYLTGLWQDLDLVLENGSMFIYSVALLSASNDITSDYNEKKATLIGFLRILSWMLIILSAVGFTLTNIPGPISSLIPQVPDAIARASVAFVGVSFFILYYSKYDFERRLDNKPERNNEDEIASIANDLPHLP